MRISIAATVLLLPLVARAQDSRTVVEPVEPPTCTTLQAATPDGGLGARIADGNRIQAAIRRCEGRGAVRLQAGPAGSTFHSGPLELRNHVTLVIERGVTLVASDHPADYDMGRGACGKLDRHGRGCRPFILAQDVEGAAIMGEGTIDGRGGALMAGHAETWWQLARRAQREGLKQNVPRLIQVQRAHEFTLHRITLRNAANFHVALDRTVGFTAWGVTIDTPADARNTDGIDPASSRDITIAHCVFRTGDDSIAIKAGATGPTENVSVLHNRFYAGHGMSIGSETEGGVRKVLVRDLTLDGGTSGLRIKSDISRGGKVRDVLYEDVCMRGVRTPIDIDTRYDRAARGSRAPDYRAIVLRHVRSVTPGRVVLRGYDRDLPLEATLDDVVIDGATQVDAADARFTLGPGPVRPHPAGEGVVTNGEAAEAMPWECDLRFRPFPAEASAPRRPQLSPAEAARFDYALVVRGADGWDPLTDALVSGVMPAADAVVDASHPPGTMARVQAAIDAAVARGGRERFHIRVRPGVYRELVYVPPTAPPITLWGEGADATQVRIGADLDAATTGARYADRFGPAFATSPASVKAMFDTVRRRETVSTPGSAVAWIQAAGFQARNLTFANEYNQASGDDAAAGARHSQAVAVAVDDADRVQFEQVRFVGFQDTLYLHQSAPREPKRAFIRRSFIEGDMDFIFGEAVGYFLDAEVRSLGARPASYVAAPSTHADSPYGFVFERSRFTHDGSPNAVAGRFKLARQWFRGQRCTPYGKVRYVEGYGCPPGARDAYEAPRGTVSRDALLAVGKMVVLRSAIGTHIDRAQPWSDWNVEGTLRYRPAQYDSGQFRDELAAAGIDAAAVTGKTSRPDPEPWLAEHRNHDF